MNHILFSETAIVRAVMSRCLLSLLLFLIATPLSAESTAAVAGAHEATGQEVTGHEAATKSAVNKAQHNNVEKQAPTENTPTGGTLQTSDPLLQDAVGDPPPMPLSLADTFWPFVKMTLMLLVVLALVYLTLHKGLGSLMARGQAGKRMRVVERISLGERKALYLVNVDGKDMLLGTGEHGLTHLVGLGSAQIAGDARTNFAQTLKETEKTSSKSPPVSGPGPVQRSSSASKADTAWTDDDEGAMA